MNLLTEGELALLEAFEQGLDPLRPERSTVPARVLGYGEISTVFSIQAAGLQGLAFKRLPLFRDMQEVERYQIAYLRYLSLLSDDIGLNLPTHRHAAFLRSSGRPVFYIAQDELPAASLGHRAIHQMGPGAVFGLVRHVLCELQKVWEYNRRQNHVRVAIDGQISNWATVPCAAVPQSRPPGPIATGEGKELVYLDTSTPLFRVDGVEQLDTELFLRSAPSFLAWILRLFFLRDVVDRYYDFHRVAVDLAANFYKEQLPELIPGVVDAINDFFAGEAAHLGIPPVTVDEIRAYYREDAMIWRLYLSMRKADRALQRWAGREYPYILPERIRR